MAQLFRSAAILAALAFACLTLAVTALHLSARAPHGPASSAAFAVPPAVSATRIE